MCLNGRGELYVSGYNTAGILDLGDTTQRLSWTYNYLLPRALGMAGGDLHSLFFNVEGSVYASGYGGNGQLGNGETSSKLQPTYVPGAPYATSVACGGYYSLIMTAPRVDLVSLTISPSTVTAGTSATGTLTLTGLAGPGGQRFYLYSSDNNAASVPAYVDVAPTSRTATFPILTNRNTLGATRTVVISTPVFSTGRLTKYMGATLTIQP